MRIICTLSCALALLLILGDAVRSEPDEQPAPPREWKVEPLSIPARDGTERKVESVVAHGDHALLVINDGDWHRTLWRADGKDLAQVRYEDKSPLRASYMFDLLDGVPTVMTVSNFEAGTTGLVRVDGLAARAIVDSKGKPIDHDDFYFTNESGVVLAFERKTEKDDEEPLHVLIDNVLQPVVDEAGKQLRAYLAAVDVHPDGRKILRRAVSVEDTFEERAPLLLEGAKARVVADVKIPDDWEASTEEYIPLFLKDRALVVALGFQFCRVWSATGEKAEWIVRTDGEPVQHDYISARHHEGTTYLLASDDTNEGIVGHVYRLEGNKAVRLKVAGKAKLGNLTFQGGPGLSLLFCDDGIGVPELWMIDGDTVSPLTTPDGKQVNAMYQHGSWRIGDDVYVTYTTPGGWFLGRLEGTVLHGAKEDKATKIGRNRCEMFDVDGEIFVVSREYFSGTVARFDNGVLHTMKHDKKALADIEVSVVKAGHTLYVTLTDLHDERTFWTISR